MRVRRIRAAGRRKLGSNLGQIPAENGLKLCSLTQSQAKRINEIALRWLLRDQGVGGSNPLSPTIYFSNTSNCPDYQPTDIHPTMNFAAILLLTGSLPFPIIRL